MHCDTDAHATPANGFVPSTACTTADPGAPGLNVTSPPLPSTAVHCDTDGHATETSVCPLSTVTGVTEPGFAGLKVTAEPAPTAVHWATEGHATAVRATAAATV